MTERDDAHRKGGGSGVIRNLSEVYYQNQRNEEGNIRTPFLKHSAEHGPDKTFFVVYCAVCHMGLCQGIVIGKSLFKKENIILIEPCPICLEEARKKG